MAAAGIFDLDRDLGGGNAVVLRTERDANVDGEGEREKDVGEEEGGAEVIEWGRGIEGDAGHFVNNDEVMR